MAKFKKFRGQRRRMKKWFKELAKGETNMFEHWVLGMTPQGE